MSQKPGGRRIMLLAAVFAAAWSPVSPAMALPGDMNCDGTVNSSDITLFVDALLSSGGFGGCDINRADMNADTRIDGRDTQPFLTALLNPTCPDGLTLCGGLCIDTNWDALNCGSCGNVCQNLEYCSWGVCGSYCPDCEP